jgi:hypothetical protein
MAFSLFLVEYNCVTIKSNLFVLFVLKALMSPSEMTYNITRHVKNEKLVNKDSITLSMMIILHLKPSLFIKIYTFNSYQSKIFYYNFLMCNHARKCLF